VWVERHSPKPCLQSKVWDEDHYKWKIVSLWHGTTVIGKQTCKGRTMLGLNTKEFDYSSWFQNRFNNLQQLEQLKQKSLTNSDEIAKINLSKIDSNSDEIIRSLTTT
jgi:hypothetical protein